jgi:hypothetical protein
MKIKIRAHIALVKMRLRFIEISSTVLNYPA